MRNSTWKSVERALAKEIGGERVPITGRSRGSAPDIEDPRLSIEVKHRKKLPDWIHEAMEQAEASNKANKIPTVILHEKSQRYNRSFVVLRLETLLEILDELHSK